MLVDPHSAHQPRNLAEKKELYNAQLTLSLLDPKSKELYTRVPPEMRIPITAPKITEACQTLWHYLSPPPEKELTKKAQASLMKARRYLENALKAEQAKLSTETTLPAQDAARNKAIENALEQINSIRGMPKSVRFEEPVIPDDVSSLAHSSDSPHARAISPALDGLTMPSSTPDNPPPESTKPVGYKDKKPTPLNMGLIEPALPPDASALPPSLPPPKKPPPPPWKTLQPPTPPPPPNNTSATKEASPPLVPTEHIGLRNYTGAACFTNAGLQIVLRKIIKPRTIANALAIRYVQISAIQENMEQIKTGKKAGDLNEFEKEMQDCLTEIEQLTLLQTLQQTLLNGQVKDALLAKIKLDKFMFKTHHINVSRQADTDEYMLHILALFNPSASYVSVISSSEMSAPVRTQVESVHMVQIAMSSRVQQSLDDMQKPESLTGINKYNHEGKLIKAQKKVVFTDIQDPLVLMEKRWDNSGRKLTRKVIADRTITVKTEDGTKHTKRLTGFVYHSGTAKGGHYVSYIFDQEKNCWYRYSDDEVKEVDEKNAFDAANHAYLLMYEE
jgi:hypothetical protein